MRRFLARPSAVALSATGAVSARPTACRRLGLTPPAISIRMTDVARLAERSQLSHTICPRSGTLSVWPSTAMSRLSSTLPMKSLSRACSWVGEVGGVASGGSPQGAVEDVHGLRAKLAGRPSVVELEDRLLGHLVRGALGVVVDAVGLDAARTLAQDGILSHFGNLAVAQVVGNLLAELARGPIGVELDALGLGYLAERAEHVVVDSAHLDWALGLDGDDIFTIDCAFFFAFAIASFYLLILKNRRAGYDCLIKQKKEMSIRLAGGGGELTSGRLRGHNEQCGCPSAALWAAARQDYGRRDEGLGASAAGEGEPAQGDVRRGGRCPLTMNGP